LWSRIDSDIEMMINECEPSQLLGTIQQNHWDHPDKPMGRVHADYAGPWKRSFYLMVVDAFSKWVEVFPVSSVTFTVIKHCLMRFFASYGRVLVSDNGTPCTSKKFDDFCKDCGIKQRFKAPYHPATNGLAERCIQRVQNCFKIALINNSNANKALMSFVFAYRRTPHTSTGCSPCKLFIGREIRSRLYL
jgi:transposase InsO family protein